MKKKRQWKPNKNRAKKPKHRKWWFNKLPKGPITVTSLIALGDEGKCVCCDTVYNLTFDHIIPKSKGGEDKTSNGQILCRKCNRIKADRIITIQDLKKEILGNEENRKDP